MRRCVGAVLAAFVLAAPQVLAQQWTRLLPDKPAKEMTLKDLQSAFEAYYKEHPVDLKEDKLRPTFRFEGERELRTRMAIEEYKMFRRWEWFAVPRTFPSARWDFEKLDAARAKLPDEDTALLLKQAEPNPFQLKFEAGKIIWPPRPFWTLVGPSDAVGGTNLGRVNCIEFDPSNSKIIYIGAADGGVWKTTDGGVTWTPKFDAQPTLSVGDIAIDPVNPQIVYVATSDAFGYGSPFWGGTYSVGVRKSTDGGNTWAATGLSWTVGQSRTIRRLVVNPTSPSTLLAATSNGLYRTTDSGATWTQVWSASTFDAEFQRSNGNIVYATTTTVQKSTDAGATFSPLTATCAFARYNIEIAQSNPNVLYTLCTNGTVQKSVDAGATWTTTTNPGVTLYGYYDNVLAVSPDSDATVYVAGFNIKGTTDGGTTWTSVPTAGHVDNHAIEITARLVAQRPPLPPRLVRTILVGNDGGLFKSTNGGTTWASLNKGLAITQFYRLGLSRTATNVAVAGAQDNGNMKYNVGTFTNITNADGMEGFIDWNNVNNIYESIQNGGLYRSTNGGVSFTGVSTASSGAWVTPWCQDPAVSTTIYAATDKVYKSTDQGTTWTAISGVLPGIWRFTVLKVAPSNSKVIYAGDGGKLYRTRNAGANWVDITAGLPTAGNYLTDVAIHTYDPSIAWAAFSGYNAGQKVYRTCDGGADWSNVSGSLPNMPANTIVHEKARNAVYVGTDDGVYYLNDELTDWVPYKWGLPNVIVDELEIDYPAKRIWAATYGRGLWRAPLK